MTTTAIWWIRRDLRLGDNAALNAALASAERVVPLFILDPHLIHAPTVGERRFAFLLAGLRNLDADLRARGSRLVVAEGDPLSELKRLMAATGARALFAAEDFSPYARRRDGRIGQQLPLHLLPGTTLFPPDAILKANGDPYVVYTPYSRAWRRLPRPSPGDILPAPTRITTPPEIPSLPIPTEPVYPANALFAPGEKEAQRRLRDFFQDREQGIQRYDHGRNRVDLQATSGLSPYLRFGMISPRQVVAPATEMAESGPASSHQPVQTWINELIWREFYIAILYHYPGVLGGNFRRQYDGIPWRNDASEFEAWQRGQTGYPIVDAGMRQMAVTGWMHNRARMITASFLVKDLLIDWRWGERWFMQQLIDGDPAANNGGWQWTAGTGTDAAPYFRIFNPITQSRKVDPEGHYIRQWLPELRRVPPKYIHEPAQMPLSVQEATGCVVGRDYPQPIVDHALARQRTLAAYTLGR